MFKHILVPTDGSRLSTKAARYAIRLARSTRARITALHVIPPFRPPTYVDGLIPYPELFSPAEYKKSTERSTRRLLARIEKAAKAGRVRCDCVSMTGEQPWQAIIGTARGRHCDLIVMASHGRSGIAAMVLGSETAKVLTHARTPVLVCR